MTTSPTSKHSETGLTTVSPWTQRNLESGTKIMEDLRIAKANKKAADAAEKQAVSTFKYGLKEGLLNEYYDELAEEYTAPGITVTVAATVRFSEKCYSEALQNAMKEERDNGSAKPTVSETIRVKLND